MSGPCDRIVTLADGTKKQRYLKISLGKNPKRCYRCNEPIGFYQLKSGHWIAVTAQWASGRYTQEGEYIIVVNRGAYGNFTPVHRCRIKEVTQ